MTQAKPRRRRHPEDAEVQFRWLEDCLSEPCLLPGEDTDLYDAMAKAIRKQLAPRGLLQRLACNDIIALRWEILRHRRMRQKSVERWFAGDIFFFYRNSGIKSPDGKRPSEDTFLALSTATISNDAERRAAGEAYFDRKAGLDRDQILAEAYAEGPAVKVHDAKLNLLMRQHRQAMRDYNDMRAADAFRDIPDAKIVKDAA